MFQISNFDYIFTVYVIFNGIAVEMSNVEENLRTKLVF